MKSNVNVLDYIRRSGTPATFALIASFLAVFVVSWMMRGVLVNPLQFFTDWSQPWGLLTYPWANSGDGTGLFWFLLEMYWLWWVGSATEADLGTRKFLIFFFSAAAVAAIFLWLGVLLTFEPGVKLPIVGGPSLAIAALTVVWGTRRPQGSVLLFAVIPVPGWLLAWLTVALTFFGFGSMYRAPLMGFFAIVHCGLAYLFASNKLARVSYSRDVPKAKSGMLKANEARDKRYYDDVKKREKEREERERLRKLFESSMRDDNEK